MKRVLASAAMLFCLSLIGCHEGDKGPVSPSETPIVNQEELQKKIESSMPPEMKKKYGKE